MRILVCGGRDYADGATLAKTLECLQRDRGISLVIAGGARGADTMAAEWAASHGVPCEIYMADWEGLGRKAGPIRNQRMLDEGMPDLVVAFPGGRGTADMVRRARAAGIAVIEAVAATRHASDCAVHDAPAYEAGACTCGAEIKARR